MNKKKEYTAFDYFLGQNLGTWLLIVLHIVIIIALTGIFSSIIERMQTSQQGGAEAAGARDRDRCSNLAGVCRRAGDRVRRG